MELPDLASNLPILILEDFILQNIYPQEELAKVITKDHRSYLGGNGQGKFALTTLVVCDLHPTPGGPYSDRHRMYRQKNKKN